MLGLFGGLWFWGLAVCGKVAPTAALAPHQEEKMNGLTGGKLKLIQAALRLITETRSLTSLGLRELAREAGLNPNTFYRHFKSLDEFYNKLLSLCP